MLFYQVPLLLLVPTFQLLLSQKSQVQTFQLFKIHQIFQMIFFRKGRCMTCAMSFDSVFQVPCCSNIWHCSALVAQYADIARTHESDRSWDKFRTSLIEKGRMRFRQLKICLFSLFGVSLRRGTKNGLQGTAGPVLKGTAYN